jgi:N-methylhydantoinase B
MGISGSTVSDGIDPVTREVVRHAVTSIADEMALIIVKASRSGVIKHNMDFSTAICDPAGRMVVQGLSLPLHLGAIPDAVRAVADEFADAMGPDDVFLLNDPYQGGMHLPDIFMIRPLYFRNTMLGYAACVCHHTDVGGRIAGSNGSDSTEIYQEGLRIPPVYYHHRGRVNDTLIRIIEKNTRMPTAVVGDLGAQLSACKAAEYQMPIMVESSSYLT